MKSKTHLRFASLFALNPSTFISLTSALAALARSAGRWTTLGCAALLATVAHPARAAAVTEAWVHRYSNVVSNAPVLETVKVVRDGAGDIIVTGRINDRVTGQDMLTIKYSGADGALLWQHRYNGPANRDDEANAVAVDGSGNVVVTGRSRGTNDYYDYYTAKYAAADGTLLWEKRYNGPGNVDDIANAVAVDGSGNVVVTGYSRGDYYTAKYAAANGALLWEKRDNTGPGSDSQAQAVAVDGSGNVVVTGFSGRWPDHDYYTAKYAAADGALLWGKRYQGPANSEDYAKAVAVDASGNVVVTGFSSNGGDSYDTDFYTAKYAAADGTLLWEKRYNGPANRGDVPSAVAVDGSGNVVVTGFSNDNGGLDDDYYTAKYAAADGALLWEKSYNGPANLEDSARALALDGSGNVVVTGYSWDPDNDLDPYNDFDYYTAEYAAADGALLWEKRSNGWGGGVAVAVDGTGNVVVTGGSSTAKFAAVAGVLLWEKRYQGPAHLPATARAVAVDGSGNVVVTGSAIREFGIPFVKPHNYDFYTAKYAVANGALLWEQRYNGPANGYDQAQALALDGTGNVVVTGFSYNGTNSDYYTAKYAVANGALLWEQRYNGPANEEDSASALAVDGSGNVVVTGISDNGIKTDYYTAKYAAADGALLWEQRSNLLTPDHDGPSGLAVDSSSNVVVTWSSYNGTNNDYYTTKYAAANGTLLWEKRYNGPANKDDYANAVAVDGSGNVVVTGSSVGSGGYSAYYTTKYAAADGALLWEKRFSVRPNSADSASSVAVDATGNVVVTGVSYDTGLGASYYTLKYAADGTLLWEKRSDGGGQAVAVDGNGNVVVTGSSIGSGGFSDYYTAKYAAADGALLWEKRYNGPVNGDDSVANSHGLALGPNGMIAITGSSDGNFVHDSATFDYATVVYRETLPSVSIDLVPTGVRLLFPGDPGRSYTLERALAVTGPWTAIGAPLTTIGGLIEYVDTNPPVDTAFYRTTTP